MMALKPRAPVFFSIACLDIALRASGEKFNSTWKRCEICSEHGNLRINKPNIPNLIHAEKHLILRDKCVSRFRQDSDQHVLGKRMEGSDNWKATNKFGNHSKINQVTGFDRAKESIPLAVVFGNFRRYFSHPSLSGCPTSSTATGRRRSKSQVLWSPYEMELVLGRTWSMDFMQNNWSTFSFLRRETMRSSPVYAPEATKRMFVVSTWIVSPRSFRGAFLSGTLTIVPSSIFSIPCWTPSPPTSRSWWIPGTAPILSTSSRNTIPMYVCEKY